MIYVRQRVHDEGRASRAVTIETFASVDATGRPTL